MRIDNHPVLPDRDPDPDEAEFWSKLTSTLIKALKMEELPDIVHAFRQVEAESISRASDDAVKIVEVKRHIAHTILTVAHRHEQSFEVARDAWNALVELGFSDITTCCIKAWFYADSCLFNKQYDAGLAVLEDALAELGQWLQTTVLKPKVKEFYYKELESLHHLRDGLIAHKSSEAEGKAWSDRKDAEIDARDLNYTEREGRDQEIDIELNEAMDSITNASWSRSFTETTRDYRQLEADFLPRLQGADAFFAPEAKRRITFAILLNAHKHKQPFEVCRDLWNELARGDFRDIFQKCAMAWFYADCCLFNHQPDAGLAVIEPLIAELRNHPPEEMDEDALESYQQALGRLERLRDAAQGTLRGENASSPV